VVFTSSFISQQVGGQLQMFGQQSAYAQSFGPQMPQMTAFGAGRGGGTGIYGEQLGARMAGWGATGMAVGGAGLAVAGAMTGMPLDPFSAAFAGGKMAYGAAGGGMMGMGAGVVGGAMAALPFYMGAKAIGAYTGAFTGGMQDQAGLNSALRSNFQHFGGQGAYGRGFSQQQMGQIGSSVGGMARSNPFTSMGELNGLISSGAEAGMFTAVRDVQQFTSRFKKMIDTLKTIQTELGGSLTDAMSFVKGSQQVGIFRAAGQANFAAEIRSAQATTGMTQDQLMGLSSAGAGISRAYGGQGRQGALGSVRMAKSLGAAIQSGVVDQETLSEATGGLQGAEAIQAFSANMMQRAGAFSKRAMGRYSLYALSNKAGNGLDADMLARFQSGDISVSDVSRRAHENVASMGRAKAINSEGRLRGSMMEEGGMSAQIGMMRLALGDRVMDGGDNLAQLVMQRRFKMSRPESELMSNLMRNQGRIANEEGVSSMMSKRQTALQQDITENRSYDGFMRQLEHGLADATGLTRAREAGRNFITKMSSSVERAMNNFLGVAASSLNSNDNAALSRLAMGQANGSDIERLKSMRGAGGGSGSVGVPMAQRLLRGLGIHSSYMSNDEMLSARGTGGRSRDAAIAAAQGASQGLVFGDDATQLGELTRNKGTTSALASAMFLSGGDAGDFYKRARGALGVGGNAIDAHMARSGMGGGGLTPNSVLDSFGGSIFGGSSKDNAIDFIAGGGNLARSLGQKMRGGAKRTVGGMSFTGLLGSEDSAMLKALQGLDRGAVGGFLESDSTQAAIRKMAGMSGDTKGLLAEIGGLETTAMGMGKGSKEQMAALGVVQQMRERVSKHKSIGREFLSAVGGGERNAELQRRFNELGGQYSQMGAAVTDSVGAAAGKNYTEIAEAFASGDPTKVNAAVQKQVDRLAGADSNSQAYRDEAGALGGSDVGRGLLRSASGQRQFIRDVTGGGRRGGRQANETAINALTGGTFGNMEITVGGRRRALNANQAMAMMQGRLGTDKMREELMGKLEAGLTDQGIKDAKGLVSDFAGMAQGGIDKDEAKKLLGISQREDIQGASKAATAAMQASRDPLGVERNDLLKQIVARLPAPASDKDPDAIPKGG